MRALSLPLLLLVVVGCASSGGGGAPDAEADMGSHRRQVTTDSAEAQRAFDDGLIWAYAFNHDEAIRCFGRATEIDPDCAMAWWGVALCHGPHINNPVVPDERSAAAWAALSEAVARKDRCSPVEVALITALEERYAEPWPADRAALDQAYADAMAAVWARYPEDPDVGALYGEALMDLQPWNLYTQQGEAREGTAEITAILEQVLVLDPDHPGANHLYIHAIEPSDSPGRALAAADRLRDLVPASGHLLHMPSHIDVLVGQWNEAIEQNRKAMAADVAFRAVAPEQEFQHLYMSHNSHMLAFAAMMSGREAEAMAAARSIWVDVPEDKLRAGAAYLDYMMCAVYDVQKRFGRWDDILREPEPPAYLPFTHAVWRHARAIAFAANHDFESAETEQRRLLEEIAAIPADRVVAINPASMVLEIAALLVEGEIALQRGDLETAAEELRAAVAIEDQLLYMEPPEWIQPVRHTLGAVLLTAEAWAEAEQVYRDDLANWPNNGWSLFGLSRALEAQGRAEEAAEVEQRYRQAWADADALTETSCKCIPKT